MNDRTSHISSVVVATDLSEGAAIAVETAAALARNWQAELCLLHVFNDSLWGSLQSIYDTGEWGGEAARLASQNALKTLSETISQRFGIRATHEFRSGRAAQQIGEFVQTQGAQLLVVGEHGENWIGDTVIGGTALKVLEQAAIPVLLVRKRLVDSYDHVVIATDFSDHSLRTAQLTCQWFPQAKQTLLHAYRVPFEGRMRIAGASEADIARYRHDEHARAAQQMQAFIDKLACPQLKVGELLINGFPATAIFEHAGADVRGLIAINKHSGSLFEERLLGSVTQNVLYHATGDVLIVP